jgi:ABC-2 type transport system ATP-binding protein
MSIIGNPSMIFLDEPTAGLDPISRRDILDIIKKL